MTKKLFLCSELSYVANSVAEKLGKDISLPAVFLMTPLSDKKRSDKELDFHYKNIAALRRIGVNFDFYDISGKSEIQITRDLDKYKLMYVEGGNPFYLLARSQENNFAQYLHKRIKEGLIYISTSAGSLILGPDIAAVARPGKGPTEASLSSTKGFNIVNFNVSPHWGSQSKHDLYMDYKIPQSYKEDHPYFLISNYQYLEVVGDWINIVDVQS